MSYASACTALSAGVRRLSHYHRSLLLGLSCCHASVQNSSCLSSVCVSAQQRTSEPSKIAAAATAALSSSRASSSSLSVRSLSSSSASSSSASSFSPSSVYIPVRSAPIPTVYDPRKPDHEQDKLLFTPGPLSTSYSVKSAMSHDVGSRDVAFIRVVKEVCDQLVGFTNADKEFVAIPVQGSGTFGVEATLTSAVNRNKGVLIISNGAYGARMLQIAKIHKLPHVYYEEPDDTQPSLTKIDELLKTTAAHCSHVAVVHSETTSGIVNHIDKIGEIVKRHNRIFIVDAMSSFGAIPVNFSNIDFLVSSANKCIEGVPGFAFTIARKSELIKCKGNASTLSLDLEAQRSGLDSNGQFRFTPPTHSMLAFRQALEELKLEGGILGRGKRYKENQNILQEGMNKLGYNLYLKKENQGPIISSYHYPKDKNWNFNTFYNELNDLGFVIYPGKVSKADCFRIGHIGRIFPEDTKALLKAIEYVSKKMKTAAFYQP